MNTSVNGHAHRLLCALAPLREVSALPRVLYVLLAVSSLGLSSSEALAQEPKHVLILVGPSNHPPGTHEVAAGARLMKHCLEHAENVSGITADVVTAWPEDRQRLQKIATVVFSGDRFPPAEMPDRERIMG